MITNISIDELIDSIIFNLEDLQTHTISKSDKELLLLQLQFLAYILGSDGL